jgi:hypothetical protein
LLVAAWVAVACTSHSAHDLPPQQSKSPVPSASPQSLHYLFPNSIALPYSGPELPGRARLVASDRLAVVVTVGSTTTACSSLRRKAVVVDPHEIRVDVVSLIKRRGSACTLDIGIRTFVVPVNAAELDEHHPILVSIVYSWPYAGRSPVTQQVSVAPLN